MNSKPEAPIVVLIPHYNAGDDLWTSIDSISEEFPVDVLIVDDGSRQVPDQEELRQRYDRGTLFVLKLEHNQGIEYALNHGMDWIAQHDYPFVARLDCGDTNAVNKYGKQIDFLNKNPEIMLLGTWVNIVDEHRNHLYVLEHPTSHKEIKKKMYLNSMFVHPTVVFRAALLNSLPHYPVKYKAAEDYAYFFQVVERYQTANLPQPLLDYVIDPGSISSSKRRTQVWSRIRVILNHFRWRWFPVYGLVRNVMLLFMSRSMTNKIKKQLSIASK